MSNVNPANLKIKKIKLDFKDSKYATGRRKKSIAKVWVKKGSGNIHVNGLKMNEYFKRPVHQIIVKRPLEISEVSSNYDVKCSVKGGGLSGQAGAIILGISKDSIESHKKFKIKHNIKFDLLSDEEKKSIKAYKTWGKKKFMGREYDGIHRTTFIINKEGIIDEIIKKPKTKFHAQEILDFLNK